MSFVSHFNKYNKWYSFILLLIVTVLVVLLFLRVEQLDTEVSKQLNEPTVSHSKTVQEYNKKVEAEKAAAEESMEGEEGEGEMVEE